MKRIDALRVLAELTTGHPVVVTCAATSRELAAVADRDNHFYLLDSMGLAGSVATGIALDRPTGAPKTIALEGDGSLLMNPNVLMTGGYLRAELLLIVLDNAVYGSTGNLPTYSSRVNLAAVAQAAGWEVATAADEVSLRTEFRRLAVDGGGPTFLHVPIGPGNAEGIAKLLVDPVTLSVRFTRWLTTNDLDRTEHHDAKERIID